MHDDGKLEAEVELKAGMRKIRNIEFNDVDCGALFKTGKKVTGTTINAVGAVWQQRAEAGGDVNANWCIFSSWLCDIVLGKAPVAAGTLEDHVKAACPNGNLEGLLAKRLWLIPLRGGSPSHWVLGWLDHATFVTGLFDSFAELGSSYWAEPLLLEVATSIRACIKAPKMTWNDGRWSRKLYCPHKSQCQVDGWSCGLFLLMAVYALAHGNDWRLVTDAKKDEMRALAIRELLAVPIWRFSASTKDDDSSGDEVVEVTEGSYKGKEKAHTRASGDIAAMTDERDTPVLISTEKEEEGKDDRMDVVMMEVEKNDPPETPSGVDVDPAKAAVLPQGSVKISKGMSALSFLKRKRATSASDTSDDYNTDDDIKRTETASGSSISKPPRRRKKTENQRREQLEVDEWTTRVESKRVRCGGCASWVTLQGNRSFDSKNWESHRATCSQITGVKVKRLRAVQKLKFSVAPPGVAPLMNFFRKLSPSPKAAKFKEEGSSASNTVASSPVIAVASGSYITQVVTVPKSIALTFERTGGFSTRSSLMQTSARSRVACRHLAGQKYEEYILRSQTRTFGGISFEFRARLSRQLFPYKMFPPLKKEECSILNYEATEIDETEYLTARDVSVPKDGNSSAKFALWTAKEKSALEEVMRAWSRWEVDYVNGYVRSSRCEGTTSNRNEICNSCGKVAEDASFKKVIQRKAREAALPTDEQRHILAQRTKHAPKSFTTLEAHSLKEKLKDPLIFDIYHSLERGDQTDCFLKLYHHARTGKLKNMEVFNDLCSVMADKVERDASGNPNAKYGIRYTKNYLNFMVLIRSHGQNSAKQYGILAGQIPAPSSRHLRMLVANSEDALQNPLLVYENIARVKRLIDSLGYTGPVAIAGDCTKVRARLTYSNDFGSHILGSTLPLDECEVDNSDDIDEIIEKIAKKKVQATQVRAILVKIPLPQVPPQVIALIPTSGKDDAEEIHEQHMKILKMAANIPLLIVSFAADGAASEMAAQVLMDKEATHLPHVTFQYPLYGVDLKAPVFRHTGPIVSVSDASHGRKTMRNNPQHGTHTASLGSSVLVNRTLIAVYECPESALVKRDVENVDKQDDGAARRLFHQIVLWAITEADGAERKIKEGLHGIFVYLFVFGTLIDAWLSRTMTVEDRILAAFRARFFLHMWRLHILRAAKKFPDLYSTARSFISPASFHIFNRLCDSLILLAIIYARYYPTHPFCPWLLGTEFVEHFFGLARMLLPNFTYGEFLKMVKHIMVRQRLLLSGKFNEKRERTSACGYIMDYDATPIHAKETQLSTVNITDQTISELVVVGFNEASHICKDILHIPVAQPTAASPIELVSIGAHLRKPKAKGKAVKRRPSADHGDSSSSDDDSDDDFDDSDSDGDIDQPSTQLEPSVADYTAEAAHDAARYSALCEEHDALLDSVETSAVPQAGAPSSSSIPSPLSVSALSNNAKSKPPIKSQILDGTGKASVCLILKYRDKLQSGTTARSEQVIKLNPKFSVPKDASDDDPAVEPKISSKEASHRIRIVQAHLTTLSDKQPRKDREHRWKTLASALRTSLVPGDLPNLSNRNVNALYPMTLASFVIVRNESRMYIGKVLDMYKKATSARYGSVTKSTNISELQAVSLLVYLPLKTALGASEDTDDSMDEDGSDPVPPLFSCKWATRCDIHTYANVKTVVYHLGLGALLPVPTTSGNGTAMILSKEAATHWTSLSRKPAAKALPKLLLRIPGGRKAA